MYFYNLPVYFIHYYVFLIYISVFLIHYLCINRSRVVCDVRAWRQSGPWSPLGKYVLYTACSTQLTTGLECTLSLTREYMEHGGSLPANCALTVYYLWFPRNRIFLFRHETKFRRNFAKFRRNFVLPTQCFVSFRRNFVKKFGESKRNEILLYIYFYICA